MICKHTKMLIIGCCGAGKSTLAKKLHARTQLPLIHLDRIYYQPNWQRPTKQEWEQQLSELCLTDRWIMDGNYISSLPLRAASADAIVYLHIDRYTCLYRAIRRVFRSYRTTRSDMAIGCEERFSWQLYRFIWNFETATHPRILHVLEQEQGKPIYMLRNKKEIAQFLQSL